MLKLVDKKIVTIFKIVCLSGPLVSDMEWLEGPGNMVVDIGYMPEMSLAITAPSELPQGEPRKHTIKPRHVDTSNMVWTEEISKEEALSNLEVRFYAFKQVSGLWVILSSTFHLYCFGLGRLSAHLPVYLFIHQFVYHCKVVSSVT